MRGRSPAASIPTSMNPVPRGIEIGPIDSGATKSAIRYDAMHVTKSEA